MICFREKVKIYLVTEILISPLEERHPYLFWGSSTLPVLQHSRYLRVEGDVVMWLLTDRHRCFVHQWSWLDAHQHWSWGCEKALEWPVPMLMSPVQKRGIWSGALTSRVGQCWVQTSKRPGKDNYSVCLHHLEKMHSSLPTLHPITFRVK